VAKKKANPNDRLYTMPDIHTWCDEALPGQEYIYWTGFVAVDRFKKTQDDKRHQCASMAKAALDLFEKGKVALIQRRKPKRATWDYVAVKLYPSRYRRTQSVIRGHSPL
jgi:hypothetical protein